MNAVDLFPEACCEPVTGRIAFTRSVSNALDKIERRHQTEFKPSYPQHSRDSSDIT